MVEEHTPAPPRPAGFSEAFAQFITADWAPYSPTLPAPLPAAAHTAARHARLAELFPGERLVVAAGGLVTRSNDTDYLFRPRSAFAYLTGLGADREPDAVFVLQPDGLAELYFKPRAPRTDPEFYADHRYGEMWVGQRESIDEMAALTGLTVRHIDDLAGVLADGTPTRYAHGDDLGVPPQERDVELAQAIAEMQLTKDAFEVSELKAACDATAVAFTDVIRELPHALAHGRGERWIEGTFGRHARHLGNAVGYETIAASGDHACTLHWVRNDGDISPDDLILVDAGIERDSLYTADITRTFPASGRFSEPQRRVYDAVLRAQQAGMDAAVPGATLRAVHDAAVRSLCETLDSWGLLPVSVDETLDLQIGGQYRRWMVHGTSHHLGLDVHDCAHARNEEYRGELKPGMVFTVEPGLYFKSTDLAVPAELRGIGVRIEDDVLMTEDGLEVLSDALPRTADDVEAWIARVQA